MYDVCMFCNKPLLNLEPNMYDNRFLWAYTYMNVPQFKRDTDIKNNHTQNKLFSCPIQKTI